MRNIKAFAVASDGNMKRIAITYDELDNSGKVVNSNIKINRIITDETILTAVSQIENYSQTVVDAE